MQTLERIEMLDAICKLFPEIGFRGKEDLIRLVELELKSLTALDDFFDYGGAKTKAIAPRQIYHVLAANLYVAGFQSVLLGLLVGSFNVVQCPQPVTEPLLRFISLLPKKLKNQVKLCFEFNQEAFEQSDCIVVFGGNRTIEHFKALTPSDKRFVGHGHKVSLIWVGTIENINREKITLSAKDISLFNQLGCLSPQSMLIEENTPSTIILSFCEALAESLSKRSSEKGFDINIEELAAIKQLRDCAKALGWTVWESSLTEINPWTVIHRRSNSFEPTCGYRTIYVDSVDKTKLKEWLKPIQGMISTVGVFETIPDDIVRLFINAGVTRFCSVGEMQQPSAFWHHDGRNRIEDLVRWVDWEIQNQDVKS
ncbi:acyl-CoA reductase [Methylacidiphilum sp. Yel]|uniref:acyl-CoA reductase n=1 Tax=Methylacidiphilum sp. Yel TaxID=1847730 RepID=UPI00106C8C60|nr:acyl-CoA reductase [Methylacidiphilum sp. Yel]TFE70924.1 acyl-CoA reductase [Methylacidiphilum sp. Yel]